MNSIEVFNDTLNILGFSTVEMREEITSQGVTTGTELASLTSGELEQIFSESRHTNRRRLLINQVVLSVPARSKLEAFRYELHLRDTCGSPMTQAQLTGITVPFARELVIQQQDRKEAKANADALPSVDVPKLTSKNWRSFRDAFQELLSRQIGSYGIPLSYIIRVNDEPLDYDAEYSALSDKLIACTLHQGTKFVSDNKLTFSLLSTHLKDSEAESTVKRFNRSRNGRACWAALKIHFESESYKSTMKTIAIANIRASEYNGPKKNFTLSSLYQIHSQAHNMLEEAGLPYSESQKIQEFQSCLKEKVSIEKSVSSLITMGINPTFENYYNNLNGQISAIITLSEAASGTPRNSTRAVNEFNTEGSGRGSGRGRGRGYSGRGRGRGRSYGRGGRGRGRNNGNNRHTPYNTRNWAPHLGSYTDDEWYALTYSQKTRVFDLRNQTSGPNNRRPDNNENAAIPSQVNATTSTNQSAPLPPAPPNNQTPIPSSSSNTSITMSRGSAGSAFNRNQNSDNQHPRWN